MDGRAQEKTAFIVASCVVTCVVQAPEYHSAKRKTRFSAEFSARATGLEPATTGSTVRYSIQLSYAPERRMAESIPNDRAVKGNDPTPG